MADALYSAQKTCVVCDQPFEVTRVRNRLTMVKQDSDFCTYYKETNPNYYAIWVCPHCGYAAQDTYFEEVPGGLQRIQKFLAGRQVNVDFSGLRTREQAIATYKLAIFFAELNGTLNSRLGALYMKLGWLFREGGLADDETKALDKAREYYEEAFLREKAPFGNMSQLALEYLIGQLYFRAGRLPEALNYLGKVVGNPQAKQEKRILELAKEAWHIAREEKKRQMTATDEPEAEEENK